MSKSKKIVSVAFLFALAAPMAVFAQNDTNASTTSTTSPFAQMQQRRGDDDRRGDNNNRGGDNHGNRDNDNRGDRDHRGDRNHHNWNRHDWNRNFGWDRNNWRRFNWRGYNWRGYGMVNNVVAGRVLDVSPDSVLVLGNNGLTYLVGTETARIMSRFGRPMPSFRLNEGDRIVVSGVIRGNTVYAFTITDLSI